MMHEKKMTKEEMAVWERCKYYENRNFPSVVPEKARELFRLGFISGQADLMKTFLFQVARLPPEEAEITLKYLHDKIDEALTHPFYNHRKN